MVIHQWLRRQACPDNAAYWKSFVRTLPLCSDLQRLQTRDRSDNGEEEPEMFVDCERTVNIVIEIDNRIIIWAAWLLNFSAFIIPSFTRAV